MNKWLAFLAGSVSLMFPFATSGQQLLLDRGVRVEGLWCFPIVTDENEYVYIPNAARLSTNEQGNPEFSFIRYVMNLPNETGTEGAATLTTAAGGGVLHFLLLYETPENVAKAAEQALREKFGNDDLVLRGPIAFDDGRYVLVSSILNPDSGEKERKVLSTGKAPVIEGNKIALSFHLDRERTMLLMESFKMATPDISIMFEMKFHGLSEAYDAELYINWSEVRKSKSFEAGGSLYVISADVGIMVDELFRNNAIRLISRGSDASMEALLNNVYAKLLELMFRPVEPDSVPPDKRGDLADAVDVLVNQKGGPLSSRKTLGFGLYAGFQLKEMQSSGTSVLNFNHRASVDRHSFITFNIGDFYEQYGSNEKYFKPVNLDDPTYLQRDIEVKVDGALLEDFAKYINNVTVKIEKVQDGLNTVDEIVIDRDDFDKKNKLFKMKYGWKGSSDTPAERLAWLKYLYKTTWSFRGGGDYQTKWTETDAPMINLFAPYEKSLVQLEGDPDVLKVKGVRAVIVEIEYPFFDETKKVRIVYRPGQPLEEKNVQITLPAGHYDYHFTTTWILKGGNRITKEGKDSTGLIFIDEMPEG